MLSDVLLRATHPTALFHGLELDAADPERMAMFWGAALGGVIHHEDDQWRVDPGSGRPAREVLRFRPATGARSDDARVHVDVRLPGPEPDHLLDAGARLIRPPGDDPWYVLADPEHNHFCAFPAVDDRPPGVFELVVKCPSPHTLAPWWARALGGQVAIEGEAAAVVGAPEFPWDYMVFDPLTGPPAAPSRMRWHLDLRDPGPGELVALGATVIESPEPGDRSWTLADPAGNLFHARGSS